MTSDSSIGLDGDRVGRGQAPGVTLIAQPERSLIRHTGSYRHIVFGVKVDDLPPSDSRDRTPLRVCLVIDRSGSMAGDKIRTAKQAAVAVVDRLDQRDAASVVVFDDHIDVVRPLAKVTDQVKREIRASLSRIDARATTALHEGWLTGCRTLVSEGASPDDPGLARCFLLTDGLANVGLSDPEQIARQAAGVREHTGVNTSTFGVGPDYNESLLGPMAVAGGGQFHHLRTFDDILSTFVGEIGSLLSIAVRGATLEIATDPGVATEVVSAYWADQSRDKRLTRLNIGDLLASDERQVVVRFGFPPKSDGSSAVRARMVWRCDGEACSSPWQEVAFTYAGHEACDAERRDGAAMRHIGSHHAERVKVQATELAGHGDMAAAIDAVSAVIRRIREYAGSDPGLAEVLRELDALRQEISERKLNAMAIKEAHFQSYRKRRAQSDYR